MIWRSPDRK